jgi:acyl dehydratase
MSDPQLVIPSLSAVKSFVGTKLGPTQWVEISQQRIDRFAEATDDDQWIHTDVERARRESPWQQTIAHGYLTLALVPSLLRELLVIRGGTTAVNTGLDKMRLSSPVPSGSRVRMTAEIKDARPVPGDGMRITFGVKVEVEDNPKPACIASVNYAYFP